MSNYNSYKYVYELGGGELADWIVEQLASDIDKRDATITKLTKERDALRAALLPLTEFNHMYCNERLCCPSTSRKPHAPDCAAMAALRQGGE